MKNILMNTEMTKAILDGRKVQTRRVIKSVKDAGVEFKRFELKGNSINGFWSNGDRAKKFAQPIKDFIKQEAKYQIGETIWVREPAKVTSVNDYQDCFNFKYLADDKEGWLMYLDRWINDDGLTVPKWAEKCQGIPNGCIKEMARIFLKVTDVRVEKLEAISYEDILAEGFDVTLFNGEKGQLKKEAKKWWINLWNKTASKGYKYGDDVYVFVYEFERVENV